MCNGIKSRIIFVIEAKRKMDEERHASQETASEKIIGTCLDVGKGRSVDASNRLRAFIDDKSGFARFAEREIAIWCFLHFEEKLLHVLLISAARAQIQGLQYLEELGTASP